MVWSKEIYAYPGVHFQMNHVSFGSQLLLLSSGTALKHQSSLEGKAKTPPPVRCLIQDSKHQSLNLPRFHNGRFRKTTHPKMEMKKASDLPSHRASSLMECLRLGSSTTLFKRYPIQTHTFFSPANSTFTAIRLKPVLKDASPKTGSCIGFGQTCSKGATSSQCLLEILWNSQERARNTFRSCKTQKSFCRRTTKTNMGGLLPSWES